MTQIGTFTPEQARELWQDYLRRHKPALRYEPQEVGQHRVFVKNSEAEPIPPYACMEIIGTEEIAGRTAIIVRQPTTTSGEYLFNSQYEILVASETVAGVGWAYRYGVVVMQGDGSTEAGDYLPAVGTWTITPGNGPFAVFGVHSAVDDALTGRIGTGSTGSNSTAATTGCPCTVVTGVIDPVPNGFGFTPFGTRKLAYRWKLNGLVDTLNANGFTVTESDLYMTWASENVWQSAAITRTCTSAISDDYVLAASPVDGYWVVWLEHVDGVGSAACDDEIYWVWKGDQNYPQPDRTNEVLLSWLTADTRHGEGWIDPPDMCVGCLVPVRATFTRTVCDIEVTLPSAVAARVANADDAIHGVLSRSPSIWLQAHNLSTPDSIPMFIVDMESAVDAGAVYQVWGTGPTTTNPNFSYNAAARGYVTLNCSPIDGGNRVELTMRCFRFIDLAFDARVDDVDPPYYRDVYEVANGTIGVGGSIETGNVNADIVLASVDVPSSGAQVADLSIVSVAESHDSSLYSDVPAANPQIYFSANYQIETA